MGGRQIRMSQRRPHHPISHRMGLTQVEGSSGRLPVIKLSQKQVSRIIAAACARCVAIRT